MAALDVHGKKLPIPSFFQVYNFGGGNGDKDREIVYSEYTGNTPALVNYYYINNRFPHLFQSKLFDDTSMFKTVGDLYNSIRQKLIKKGEIYRPYQSKAYDFNQKVFLLDSGAFSIVKAVAERVHYDVHRFHEEILKEAVEYYDFANRLRFDIVVGFDLGGKYTKKDGESTNQDLIAFLSEIDSDTINMSLTELTIQYLQKNPEYYPKVLATVHGHTPTAYEDNVKRILLLEQKYHYQFWGFALGGIASSKQVDKSWYSDIDFSDTGKRGFIDTIAPARACRIVRNLVGTRPIHALGCGGYQNITLNYYCGATSFDAASPVRRVGDGSLVSTKIVFDPTPVKTGFSKFFIGGINDDGTLRTEDCIYVKLNEVPDTMLLCGCKACKDAESVHNIKYLYSLKEHDDEANYYSRQLIGLHAVLQHRKLCEVISEHPTVDDFCKAYPSKLNQGLLKIYQQL
ncbi:MAG: hypothetical protein IJK14_01515 [Clostridia bacterium]|nr:hypothetical protein [Clostridia bacterium]